jgi:hypothetical protein
LKRRGKDQKRRKMDKIKDLMHKKQKKDPISRVKLQRKKDPNV